jgi:hypothetical protein
MRLPKSRTVTASAIRMTIPMSCSTSRIEMPRLSRTETISPAISRRSPPFMPATGSSSSSSRGSTHSARASSTRFCTPYGSSPTGVASSPSTPAKAAISSTRAPCRTASRRAEGSRSPAAANPLLVSRCRPSIRLSRTVSRGDSAMFWNVRATPSRATRCGRRTVSSSSPKRTLPAVAR